ncbi:hypothetical protein NPA07_00860 [Mycoplasmopsis caviae]|uniref:Transposase n=1 Tax=Mycoplasmopsis caviae TaxID=55603 RepID=A0ABY5J2T5_9BACT|nr:hypothetical protein [Mycoplasmopsis caviae]UUD35149.1 hypothetical protein NPA07_05085 [Mycoplasmopsis caviae]UUD35159.1 hypothetical protein NPA07_05140 [Mycoplasmopsis caviae]UUD35205.1 hypothetical protein NPA07_05380 [Mycoplasmopsis caviae]UUD35411.1 hypothetical protein NPA07_00860 [Mycoplasmopsis caviae]
MNELGLKGIQPREKYKSFKGELNKKIPNHLLEEKEEKGYKTGKLGQNFKTSKPNQKWTTDVTEFKVKDKKHISHQFAICIQVILLLENYQKVQISKWLKICWTRR